MGLAIGGFLFPFGLILRNTRDYFLTMLKLIVLVMAISIFCGAASLAITYLIVTPENAGEYKFRDTQLVDPAAFVRAGMMHNASYFGGLLGIVVGMVGILRRFLYQETGSSKI